MCCDRGDSGGLPTQNTHRSGCERVRGCDSVGGGDSGESPLRASVGVATVASLQACGARSCELSPLYHSPSYVARRVFADSSVISMRLRLSMRPACLARSSSSATIVYKFHTLCYTYTHYLDTHSSKRIRRCGLTSRQAH